MSRGLTGYVWKIWQEKSEKATGAFIHGMPDWRLGKKKTPDPF